MVINYSETNTRNQRSVVKTPAAFRCDIVSAIGAVIAKRGVSPAFGWSIAHAVPQGDHNSIDKTDLMCPAAVDRQVRCAYSQVMMSLCVAGRRTRAVCCKLQCCFSTALCRPHNKPEFSMDWIHSWIGLDSILEIGRTCIT